MYAKKKVLRSSQSSLSSLLKSYDLFDSAIVYLYDDRLKKEFTCVFRKIKPNDSEVYLDIKNRYYEKKKK